MTATRPTIVVSLPARTAADAIRQRAVAQRAGADAVEIRFDRWPSDERARADRLFPSDVPLVATLRSAADGGSGPDGGAERAAELERLGRLPFRWIDLELGRDEGLADRLPGPERIGRIVSCHLSAADVPKWTDRLAALEASDGIGKLVLPASVRVALEQILPRIREPRDEPVVVLTTGPSGPLLRALSGRLGAPLVYAALPEAAGEAPVEPAQIPVDRLRPFLDADESARLYGVAGRPIAHSQSPAVHSGWFRAERRAGLYVALECADDAEFVDALPLLAAAGFRGLNVTQPFKEVAFAAASEADPSAAACGAANCLTLEDGGIRAANTDLAAILRRFEELRDSGTWDGRRVEVIGAGGAARATLAAARELRIPATVHARNRDAATALATIFGARVGPAGSTDPGALVVHATDVGRSTGSTLDARLMPVLASAARIVDWVYRPVDPVVGTEAWRHGVPYEDGWRLFVYQAAASYGLWWDEPPAPDLVDRTVREGPCAE